MPNYFRNFPIVRHSGQNLLDITRRSRFIETLAQDPTVYLPYTIKSGETAEELSYYYYDTVDLVWMIYFANNMVDPYKDWPMRDQEFRDYVADKYKDEYEAATGNTDYTKFDVLAWTADSSDDTYYDNILYFQSLEDDEVRLSPESYLIGSSKDPMLYSEDTWIPVRIYEAEELANDNKRVIRLINKNYAPQIAKEFKRLMNE